MTSTFDTRPSGTDHAVAVTLKRRELLAVSGLALTAAARPDVILPSRAASKTRPNRPINYAGWSIPRSPEHRG